MNIQMDEVERLFPAAAHMQTHSQDHSFALGPNTMDDGSTASKVLCKLMATLAEMASIDQTILNGLAEHACGEVVIMDPSNLKEVVRLLFAAGGSFMFLVGVAAERGTCPLCGDSVRLQDTSQSAQILFTEILKSMD